MTKSTDTDAPAPGSTEWHRVRADAGRANFRKAARKRYDEMLAVVGVDSGDMLPAQADHTLVWLASTIDESATEGLIQLLEAARAIEARRIEEIYHDVGVELVCRCGQTDQHRVTENCGNVLHLTDEAMVDVAQRALHNLREASS